MEQKLYYLLHKMYMRVLKVAAKFLPISKPTLFFGKDSLSQLCHSVSIMGVNRVLVVSDEGIEKLGFIKRLVFEFERVGVHCEVFNGVIPDPTYDQVEAGLALYHKHKCHGVVAIGGGSSIDCAKVIAACVTNKKPIEKLVGILRVWKAPAPLFVLPTTAGTGSEVTVAAVVSDPKTHLKTPLMDPKLVPIAAALDPSLMLALPAHITAQTGMDALTHAVEAYISGNATAETDRYAIAAVKLIDENLVKAVKFGQNSTARQRMALASYYGGLAFTKASLGYTHAIAHSIGAKYGTPHGLANAIILPYVLEHSKFEAKGRLANLADTLDIVDRRASDTVKAQAFIDYIKALCLKLDLPGHFDVIIDEHVSELAQQSLREAHWNYPVPRYMQQEECEQLIASMAHIK
ncbi:iron-containing alcohol dehydrogenase [Vibrio genomosp. F10]|uniref:Alcohol dehydrogenase n=2 Tax=Vibrio genomosp. F10 TaxID=723171 RepID=A0A1B9QU75_9VIBR|nr:iron-containing alcohol dehydrogenase [Vibrio genomosp. F10]OCH70092.1 alcohol dehydrogenase [Vibrio genomosp. F10]OEE37125.1 alcohol dehydrogenase [Vibrio genomosp. F10 str. ZF-129]OEE94115.1 alcohol dehydrogenase [Vibrio genomosp. F10 str. 9ZC157]